MCVHGVRLLLGSERCLCKAPAYAAHFVMCISHLCRITGSPFTLLPTPSLLKRAPCCNTRLGSL